VAINGAIQLTQKQQITYNTMKNISFSITFLLLIFAASACKKQETPEVIQETPEVLSTFHSFKMLAIDGTEVDFSQYKGKKVLIVNTASACGFTPQFTDLQTLHEQMGDKVAILGFPANNFFGQEPKDNEEIATFCTQNYGVTFQMFEKIDVIGANQHALYKFLSDKTLNGWNDQAPTWNFCKYIIDKEGNLTKFFSQTVNPLDQQIIDAINE
jgi:glutathione peroxidase